MQLLKLLRLPIIILLLQIQLYSAVYENGEDGTIKRWDILPPLIDGSISNVYDKEHKSYVIELTGSGTRSAYILKLKSYDLPQLKILQWEMKYSQDFVIIIDVSTKLGQRYLIYTPSDNSDYLQFGLGKSAISNSWQKYSRNLEDDLKKYEQDNTILALNNFIIRGTGRIDNIELLIEKGMKIVSKKVPLIKPKNSQKNILKEKNIIPKIKILGDNPLILKPAQKYIEAGATAKDVNGSELSINISHNIDIYKDGEYSVIYMTKNSIGNTAVDRRIVRVGKIKNKKENKNNHKNDENKKNDKNEGKNETKEKEVNSQPSMFKQPDFIYDIAKELREESEAEYEAANQEKIVEEKVEEPTLSRSDYVPEEQEDFSNMKRSDYK